VLGSVATSDPLDLADGLGVRFVQSPLKTGFDSTRHQRSARSRRWPRCSVRAVAVKDWFRLYGPSAATWTSRTFLLRSSTLLCAAAPNGSSASHSRPSRASWPSCGPSSSSAAGIRRARADCGSLLPCSSRCSTATGPCAIDCARAGVV